MVSSIFILKAGSRGSQGFSKSSAVFSRPEAVFVTVGEVKPEILGMACLVLILVGECRFSRALVNENSSSIARPLYIIPISFPGLCMFLEMRCLDLTVCFAIQSESSLLVFLELMRAYKMFKRLISVYITSE